MLCIIAGAQHTHAFDSLPRTDGQTTPVDAINKGAPIAGVLPTDQAIHPAGLSVGFEGRPTAIAIRPGGHTAAILKTMGKFMPSKGPILILDLESKRVLQEFCSSAQSDASFTGLAYSPDGSRLFGSDPSGSLMMAAVAPNGTLHNCRRIALPVADSKRGAGLLHPEGSNTGYPGGIAVAQSGHCLYVAMSMNNSVAIVDLDQNRVSGEIAVGNAPYAIAVDGDIAYVTNQG
jgi:YVTN family beta-propeller protein